MLGTGRLAAARDRPRLAAGVSDALRADESPTDAAGRKLALLRAAVQQVLDDEESGESGWGPDITMVTVLREAMEASA